MLDKGIFIVGVRKCGTTSLFDVLAQHSLVSPCRHKEPQFFCMDKEVIEGEINWYEGLFKDKTKWLLDGSTLYYQYPQSYKQVNDHFNETKFIVCLRDPAKRFFSAYWHMKAKPQKVETRSLKEIIDSIKGGSQQEMVENEKKSLEAAAKQNKIDSAYLNEAYHSKDMMANIKTKGLDKYAFFEYYRESLYSLNYNHFTTQQNTRTVFFEQLIKSPAEELKKVHAFLGLPVEDETAGLRENINKTLSGEGSGIAKLASKTVIFPYLKSALSGGVKHKIRKLLYKPLPEITEEEYNLIREMLAAEYTFWENKFPGVAAYWKFANK